MNLLRSALLLAALGATLAAHAELIYGATSTGSLIAFDSAAPASFKNVGAFSGLVAGQTVRDIDFRPATGTLYAIAAAGNAAQLYTVDRASGALTAVGAGFTLPEGDSFGVKMDFNPVDDRLRVVDYSRDNLRVNPNDGTVVGIDTALTPSTNCAALAYSNDVAGATATTLYGYDYNYDGLVTIGGPDGNPSPNGGAVTRVGRSGYASYGDIGFDISGATGVAYLAYDSPGANDAEFFTANLRTGALTQVGANDVFPRLVGLSVAPAQAVPEPSAFAALGLGALALLRRRRRA